MCTQSPALDRLHTEPKTASQVDLWASLPDSILARIHLTSPSLPEHLQPQHSNGKLQKRSKAARREAQEARAAKQLAFKLVCKAWLQGAGHSVSKGQLVGSVLPNGRLPAGLHLRFGGTQSLTLTQVKLGIDGFQELANLKQLDQLTLIDIDSHFAAISQSVVQHFCMNISRAGKLKHAEADLVQTQLMAAMPYSEHSIVPMYSQFRIHNLAAEQQNLAGRSTANTARHRPFACGTDPQGHGQQSPFGLLNNLTSLTLQRYPLARLPSQDLMGMSSLTSLKRLVLLELWSVTVPYDTLATLSCLTALTIDSSQSQPSMLMLPAVTSLQLLSVHMTTPSISQAWPFAPQYSALSGLTRLELHDVEDVTSEQLQSLSAFMALQQLSVRGRQDEKLGGTGYQHWRNLISWNELTALTGLKHLELVTIDHHDNIFDSLSCMTQLSHLQLVSLQNLYRSPLGDGLMLLAPLPHLEYLHCEFFRFSVRSGLRHDLEAQFRRLRSVPISDLEIHIEDVSAEEEEVDSDDIDSELGYEREREQERHRMVQELFEADYSSGERHIHDHDYDLYCDLMRNYEDYY